MSCGRGGRGVVSFTPGSRRLIHTYQRRGIVPNRHHPLKLRYSCAPTYSNHRFSCYSVVQELPVFRGPAFTELLAALSVPRTCGPP